jgi:hypothetical protein
LADKEQTSAGYSVDLKAESDLQNVLSYLRRSKEIVSVLLYYTTLLACCSGFGFDVFIVLIYFSYLLQAETEISLLKQEKLRLQSEVHFRFIIFVTYFFPLFKFVCFILL